MSFGFGFGFPKRLTSGGGLSPSLYLDLVGTGVLPSTVTFSRGTNATLTDSNGRVAWAPHNLLTNSEDFEAAAWGNAFTTVTANAATAPNGTATADLIFPASTGTFRDKTQQVTAVSAVYVVSCFLKASGFRWAYFRNFSASNFAAHFDLQNGVLGTVQAGFTATITDAGNGWYRCTLTSSTPTTNPWAAVGMSDADNSSTATANGSNGILVWGAQLNIGSTAQSYNSTTPKNLLGFTQEPENAAWTKSNSYVQQNLLTWSQDFDNAAWTLNNPGTRTANTDVAPDGTTTADTVTDNITTNFTSVRQTVTVANNNQQYTGSVYFKKTTSASSYPGFTLTLTGGTLKYASGALNTTTGVATARTGEVPDFITVSDAGTYWRVQWGITNNTSGNTSLLVDLLPAVNTDAGATWTATTTGSAVIWGAQLVQGSTAGDYTQTTSAAAPTRYLNWDGTLTGRKLVEDTTTGAHRLFANLTLATVTHTATVYAKAGERSWLALRMDTATGLQAWFNVATGVVGTVQSGLTASIQSVGGGWYRCSVTGVAVAANNYLLSLGTADNTGSYTGDGTSGIYVSDFQLANSASVDPYVYNPQAAAASAAFYGPRFDYNPTTLAANGLLIEEQRTNLLTYSEQYDNAIWTKSNAIVTTNTTTAPDGNTTADTLTANAGAGFHYVYSALLTSLTGTYTNSFYVKRNNHDWIFFTVNDSSINYFNLATGQFGTTPDTCTATNVGNGWYRITATRTLAAVAGNCGVGVAGSNGGASFTAAGTEAVFVWGSQLELGSFSTSYIPTVASQVTRNADSASMLGDNFYTWYNPNQGTISVEASNLNTTAASAAALVTLADSPLSASWIALYAAPTATLVGRRAAGVSGSNLTNGATTAVSTKMVYAWIFGGTDATSLNGAAAVSAASLASPYTNAQMLIGAFSSNPTYWNGTIRRISYYKTRLPDSTLRALTT